MMNLEIRHLRLIEAIHDEKTVTRAGARLNLTQSALSHQLKDIEEKLRTNLFLRVNKRLVLTPAGEAVLAAAREILPRLLLTEEAIGRIATQTDGVLRIATQCYTTYHWLPDLLATYRRKYPRVDVQILLEATRRPVEALLAGEIDLAILLRRSNHKDLALRSIFRDELVLIVPPDHRLANRKFIDPRDLTDETLILHTSAETSFFVQDYLVPNGVRPREISQVQLTEAIVSMVRGGLGVSAVANWAVAREVKAGVLRALRITRGGARRQWSAATLKGDAHPRYLGDFIDLLSESVEGAVGRLYTSDRWSARPRLTA